MSIESEVKRKVELRNSIKATIIKSSKEKEEEEYIEILDKQVQIMSDTLKGMKELYIVNDNFHIYSHRKVLGTSIVFMKNIVRKLINVFLGWYIRPLFINQTEFNEKVVTYIDNLTDTLNKIVKAQSNLTDALDDIAKKQDCLIMENKELKKNVNYLLKKQNVQCDISLLDSEIDYFAFENAFRGSEEEIMNRQRRYIEYFRMDSGAKVLDIGCGRGEFLELMRNEGIFAYGIDVYNPFVTYCSDKGLEVMKVDAITHLSNLEDSSLGGIHIDSVIEHLEDDYINTLLRLAYRKLKPNAYLVIVTLNPQSLGTLINFNVDLQHKKPIHYLTLEYLLKSLNFATVERYEAPETDFNKKVSEIKGIDFENKDEFNEGMKNINQFVFGNREFAIIAKK